MTLKQGNQSNKSTRPVALVILVSIAVISPPSVDILDVKQFLPDDDPALNELEILQSKYILGAGTETWIVIDGEGDSPEDLNKIQTFQKQLSNHPSIISIETGIYRSPLILGIPYSDGDIENDTIDTILDAQRQWANKSLMAKFDEVINRYTELTNFVKAL